MQKASYQRTDRDRKNRPCGGIRFLEAFAADFYWPAWKSQTYLVVILAPVITQGGTETANILKELNPKKKYIYIYNISYLARKPKEKTCDIWPTYVWRTLISAMEVWMANIDIGHGGMMGHQSEILAICRPIIPFSLFWFSTQEKISDIGFLTISHRVLMPCGFWLYIYWLFMNYCAISTNFCDLLLR